MSRYHKTTRQTMRVQVAGISVRCEVEWTDDDAYLAHKIIGYLQSSVNGPAAEQYQHVSPWQIKTVTTEETSTAAFDDPAVVLIDLAGRNPDPMEGA